MTRRRKTGKTGKTGKNRTAKGHGVAKRPRAGTGERASSFSREVAKMKPLLAAAKAGDGIAGHDLLGKEMAAKGVGGFLPGVPRNSVGAAVQAAVNFEGAITVTAMAEDKDAKSFRVDWR